MAMDRSSLARRAAGKIHRLSLRFRERMAAVPIRAAHRGLPLPPSRLIYLVGGSNDLAWFLGAGANAACVHPRRPRRRTGSPSIAWAPSSTSAAAPGGSSATGMTSPSTRVCGTRLQPPARPLVPVEPDLRRRPAQRPDRRRRLARRPRSTSIYALSVFTHLTEPVGLAWIDELSRVLKPGGHLLITTHGDHYRDGLVARRPGPLRPRARPSSALPGREGSNDCATFHPPAYVRDRLARGLEVVDHRPEGALGNPRQDVWLLRKPG